MSLAEDEATSFPAARLHIIISSVFTFGAPSLAGYRVKEESFQMHAEMMSNNIPWGKITTFNLKRVRGNIKVTQNRFGLQFSLRRQY
jgi:hypothetical protein